MSNDDRPQLLSPARAKQGFILVVDDEKRIADTLAAILLSKGYLAEATYDGTSALKVCRARVPDLLISDVVMPGISGVELGIAVKEGFPTCRILLFSGQAATAQMLEDAEARGHRFELLAKPVHPSLLLERVEQLIGTPTVDTAAGSKSLS